jgi:hypothetical protein
MGEDARRGCGWGRYKWVGRYVSKRKGKRKRRKEEKEKLRTKKGGKERGKETRGVVRPLGVGEGGVGVGGRECVLCFAVVSTSRLNFLVICPASDFHSSSYHGPTY